MYLWRLVFVSICIHHTYPQGIYLKSKLPGQPLDVVAIAILRRYPYIRAAMVLPSQYTCFSEKCRGAESTFLWAELIFLAPLASSTPYFPSYICRSWFTKRYLSLGIFVPKWCGETAGMMSSSSSLVSSNVGSYFLALISTNDTFARSLPTCE